MPNTLKEQGFTHFLAVLAFGAFALLLVSSVIPVTRHYADGKSNVAGVYLAKEGDSGSSGDSSGGSSGDSGSHDSGGSSGGSSGSSGSSAGSGGSSGSGSSGSSSGGSGSTQTATTKLESKSKSNEIKKEIEKREVETKEVKDSQRVEVKTTPEKIKSEIRQGNLRVKFEIENGKVKIETKVKEAENENETELENEAENEAVKEVEAELEKAEIKIATAPGQIALVNKRVGALSNFPLSVNPTTRELTVTTPAGSKVVAVLPQEAIDNMLAAHIMDDVVSEKVNNSLANVPELVKLEIKNGVLSYQVKGTKTHKLLGFIPIKTGVEAFISAENGQVVETSQSLLGRILNRIAP